ncbi:hypothetical protein D9615_006806 [Tricholomella constricta]|uniref:DUF6532 domain-containing protein n=1 Tax=Tricholomella constricta TaxID=117010 RepID=A0A8H5H756_9AGAR|nr:hypothetical protein D9615_006806 [Tricholomella constricta]
MPPEPIHRTSVRYSPLELEQLALFASNQPQHLGRGRREAKENERLQYHRNQLVKNAATAAKSLATKQRRTAETNAAGSGRLSQPAPTPTIQPRPVPPVIQTPPGPAQRYPDTTARILTPISGPLRQRQQGFSLQPFEASTTQTSQVLHHLPSAPALPYRSPTQENQLDQPAEFSMAWNSRSESQIHDLDHQGNSILSELYSNKPGYTSLVQPDSGDFDIGQSEGLPHTETSFGHDFDVRRLISFNNSQTPEEDNESVQEVDEPWTVPHARDQPEEEPTDDLAQPALNVNIRHVDTLRRFSKKRTDASRTIFTQCPDANTLAGDVVDLSSGEEDATPVNHAAKKKKRPSRSIAHFDTPVQDIINVAAEFLRCEIALVQPFPQISDESTKSLDSLDASYRMAFDAWENACKKLTTSQVPSLENIKRIRDRFSQYRGQIKDQARPLVVAAYGFKDPSSLTKATSAAVNGICEQNRKTVEEISGSFWNSDPRNATPSTENSLFGHEIISQMFNKCWFGRATHYRPRWFSKQTKVPLETIAFILTAQVECAIHEWKTGRHVVVKFEGAKYRRIYQRHLTILKSWETFSAQESENLTVKLQEDLLSNARECSLAYDDDDSNEDEDTPHDESEAMLALFKANQSVSRISSVAE